MPPAQSLKRKYKADAFDIFIGNKLRELRESLGESQQLFSLRINVTFQQIQKYERGVNRLGHHHIYNLSKQCNIPITYFTDGFAEGEKEMHLSIVKNAPDLKGLHLFLLIYLSWNILSL